MPHFSRRRLLHSALVVFLAADVLAAFAYVYSALFAVESPQVWLIAAVGVIALSPLLTRAADAVFVLAEDRPTIPNLGEKIP